MPALFEPTNEVEPMPDAELQVLVRSYADSKGMILIEHNSTPG